MAGAGLSLGATLVTGSSAEAATFTVSNLNDSGAGSLRQALLDANANPGADMVTFQSTLSGQITLASELPITDPVQVLGPGANRLTISGNSTTRILNVNTKPNSFPVMISGLGLKDGSIAGDGGAILNKYAALTLDQVVISQSRATANSTGGGIANEDGSLTVRSSTITGNSARGGGGIYSIHDRPDTVRIENSTITGNTATYVGGGLDFNQAIGYNSRVEVRNSTISGNRVTNYASYGGGGGVFTSAGVIVFVSTIVADNSAPTRPDVRFNSAPPDVSFSLIENPAGATFTGGPNVTGQDPKLGVLGDNGGPTPTIPLLAGSPALDTGLSAGTSSDQRGAPRPFDLKGVGSAAGGDSADIGAYERNLCGKVLVNRVGTAGKDKLKGTKGPDGILGLGGKDTLKGLKGNDGLCGGPGKDKLKGGAGNDRLLGQAGNDVLIGGKGRDKLKGGKGKDKQKQ